MCIPQWLLYGIHTMEPLLRIAQSLLYFVLVNVYFIARFHRNLTSLSSTKLASDDMWYAVVLATVISNVLTSQFIFAIISKNKRECSTVLR